MEQEKTNPPMIFPNWSHWVPAVSPGMEWLFWNQMVLHQMLGMVLMMQWKMLTGLQASSFAAGRPGSHLKCQLHLEPSGPDLVGTLRPIESISEEMLSERMEALLDACATGSPVFFSCSQRLLLCAPVTLRSSANHLEIRIHAQEAPGLTRAGIEKAVEWMAQCCNSGILPTLQCDEEQIFICSVVLYSADDWCI